MRAIGLHGRVGAILEAEGTLIDPLGAILTVLVFEAAFAPHPGSESIFVAVVSTLGIGVAFGLLGAWVLTISFSRYLIPDHSTTSPRSPSSSGPSPPTTPSVRNPGSLRSRSWASHWPPSDASRSGTCSTSTRRCASCSSRGCSCCSARASTRRPCGEFEWRNVAFLATLVVIVRPVCVWVSTIRSGLRKRERFFLACTAPRGIVAAAIASVFSLQLADLGVENSQILVAATFTVIAGTVLISGLGSRALALRLGLVEADRETIVVLGANPVARAFASALEQFDAPVHLVDLDRKELAAARMTGLVAHRGSVFSDDTWEEVSIQSAAFFLAMTANDELNTLAARHAAAALGRKQVFQIPPGRMEHRNWWDLPTGTFARPLFARDTSFGALAARLEAGDKIISTRLTDQFKPADYAAAHGDALVLFIVDAKGHIDLVTGDQPRKPRVGETIVALAKPARRD